MSTSIKEVVSELYRKFHRGNKPGSIFSDKFILKLQRAIKHPVLAIRKIGKLISGKNPKVITPQGNVFTATDKKFPDVKIAVYTVVTGEYDNLRDPVYVDDTIDYYAFIDSSVNISSKNVWKIIPAPLISSEIGNSKRNRYMKLHHDEMLELTGKKYDYCVYIDGNVRIARDIKPLVYSLVEDGRSIAIHKHCVRDCIYDEADLLMWIDKVGVKDARKQMKFYKKEGMPEHFGLTENTVIIRKCNDTKLNDIMHQWWLQVERFTHRDQLSLSYVLWKNGLDCSYIFSLGTNIWRNPYFLFHAHNSR